MFARKFEHVLPVQDLAMWCLLPEHCNAFAEVIWII